MYRSEVNLSRSFDVDVSSNYDRLLSKKSVPSDNDFHKCVLRSKCTYDSVSVEDFGNLLSIGCPVRDRDDVSVYKDRHFKVLVGGTCLHVVER